MEKTSKFFFVFLLALASWNMAAQEKTITGTVSSQSDGGPLPGANVIVDGDTSRGTLTDFDGNYTIEAAEGENLVFSFIGMKTVTITVGSSNTISVTLEEDAAQLDEVVVTALGIKRERKSIGYAVQEVKGAELVGARENNIANSISGKVSGVQVIRGSNGPASSSKIILRGNNSLTGDNQPLIVVDGIPMDNFTGAANNDFWNPSQDMGNGLGDLNPDDIESMSVLKGASAAALYGSRAGNGVIMITTKTGRATKGLGIGYSSTFGFQSMFLQPDLQSSFGQGSDGIYNNLGTSSWGPKIEGQPVEDWKGETVPLKAYDNLDNYFQGGFSQTHNLSFQQQVSNGTSLYSSASYLKDDSNVPGATLDRLNLTTRAVSKFGKDERWTLDTKVQYINSKAQNRPLNGVNINNAFGTVALMPRSVDIREFEDHTDEYGNMVWYLDSNSMNPYWAAEKNMSWDDRNRFMMNGVLKYQFNDWLSAEVKGGSDFYTTKTESKLYSGSPLSNTGRYSVGYRDFIETNYSTLVTAQKDNIFGKLGGSASLGGNLMKQTRTSLNSSSGELEVPNLFSLNNGVNPASVGHGFSEKKINSIYGTFQVNYDGFLFLDFTGRNDWSSALSKEQQSFFYPSVSASWVVTEMITRNGGDNPGWLSFGKLRASYAEVGNDMGPYNLYNDYWIGKDPLGNTTAGSGSTKNYYDVQSELIKSFEVGLEARMFDGRLAMDFAWYKSNATNQLIAIPIDPLSGFNSERINAGDIQNVGFELMLNGRIIDNPESFNWDMNINFSKNDNTLEALSDDASQFRLGGYDNVAILAVEGGKYGEIWGTKFKRVEDEADPNYGEIIVDGEGRPLAASGQHYLGDQQPDFMLGMSNTFTYKKLSLSFLIDARIGGEIFSGTNQSLQSVGNAAVTTVGGARENIVFDGVVDDGNGNYTPNTTEVTPQLYWETMTSRSGNLGITEANMYDATNVRVRNIQLNYNMTSYEWLQKSALQSLKVGVSANNVWMISSDLNGIDPESVYATGTNAVGFENLSSPTTKTVFLNLSIGF